MTALEEPCTRSKGRGSSDRGGPTRRGLCSGPFVQWIGRGGADPGEREQVGNRARSGAHRRPRRRESDADFGHRSIRSVATALEEPSAGSWKGVVGEETSSRAHRPWGKPRIEKGGARNDRRPNPRHPVGPGRSRQDPTTTAKFGEITEKPGRSGRRPPRQSEPQTS